MDTFVKNSELRAKPEEEKNAHMSRVWREGGVGLRVALFESGAMTHSTKSHATSGLSSTTSQVVIGIAILIIITTTSKTRFKLASTKPFKTFSSFYISHGDYFWQPA